MIREVIDAYAAALLFDLWVFSRWWLYVPLLIPALFYLALFFLKWSVLTAPLWLPLKIVFAARRAATGSSKVPPWLAAALRNLTR